MAKKHKNVEAVDVVEVAAELSQPETAPVVVEEAAVVAAPVVGKKLERSKAFLKRHGL